MFSIDAAVESYWAISRSVEVYGRWYPSYLDGYGSKSVTNTMAAGAIIRLNGGVVDVNQYTGLAALSKGQYIKAEQDVSTSNGLNWSGNRTSARIGWAAQADAGAWCLRRASPTTMTSMTVHATSHPVSLNGTIRSTTAHP